MVDFKQELAKKITRLYSQLEKHKKTTFDNDFRNKINKESRDIYQTHIKLTKINSKHIEKWIEKYAEAVTINKFTFEQKLTCVENLLTRYAKEDSENALFFLLNYNKIKQEAEYDFLRNNLPSKNKLIFPKELKPIQSYYHLDRLRNKMRPILNELNLNNFIRSYKIKINDGRPLTYAVEIKNDSLTFFALFLKMLEHNKLDKFKKTDYYKDNIYHLANLNNTIYDLFCSPAITHKTILSDYSIHGQIVSAENMLVKNMNQEIKENSSIKKHPLQLHDEKELPPSILNKLYAFRTPSGKYEENSERMAAINLLNINAKQNEPYLKKYLSSKNKNKLRAFDLMPSKLKKTFGDASEEELNNPNILRAAYFLGLAEHKEKKLIQLLKDWNLFKNKYIKVINKARQFDEEDKLNNQINVRLLQRIQSGKTKSRYKYPELKRFWDSHEDITASALRHSIEEELKQLKIQILEDGIQAKSYLKKY
ncbi:MAG: hypothetical protein ACP5N3_02105 [Candidatus Nanoarchaeia archaeon]